MTDLISRQAALEMLNDDELERQVDDVFDGSLHRYKRAAQRIIAQLPTIDPVKHGKWIADKYTRKCSECESTYWMREGNAWNYCPNCGSKNGGEG